MKFNFEIKRHFKEVKKYGFGELYRKLKWLFSEILISFFTFFFVPPLIFFLILFSKFINFRFGIVRSSRIGHFIANTELYLIEKKIKKKNFL